VSEPAHCRFRLPHPGWLALNLNRTNVTDTGLVHLQRLTNLSTVGLQHTKVSKAGCDSLALALPDCEVRR
jgi:hypothetical protein